MDSEFDKIDVCVNCKIREFCKEQPDDMSCEDVMRLAGILPKEDDSERAKEILDAMARYTDANMSIPKK